jgi:hypothetical protein
MQEPLLGEPSTVEYVPATQRAQVAIVFAPLTVEKVPAAHKRHTAEDDAPCVVEYVPALQEMQLVLSVDLSTVE